MVNKKGAISVNLFNLAYKQKLRSLKSGRRSSVWDLIIKKVREKLGIKNMKYMVTGSAPLSGDMHDFARVVFNCPLIQGYGLTETVSAGSVQRTDDFSNENIGPCLTNVEMKLVDVPDMNYRSTDLPNPRGEIWIRGPSITQGYYKDEAKTNEAFFESDDDSPYKWFASGDIGMWLPNGSLKIIDRKKNLIKPQHGEYIALEKLESVYKNCTYIDLICVYVDSLHFNCIAIVTPNRERLTAWAVTQKLPNTDNFVELCKNQKLQQFLLSEIRTTGRKLKLRSIEDIKKIAISPFEWTPQNNMLTSAMKLNRNEIVKKYKEDIAKMYEEIGETNK